MLPEQPLHPELLNVFALLKSPRAGAYTADMGQYDSWDYLTNFIKKYPDNFAEALAKPPRAVKTTRHAERPELCIFKYHQFESDFSDPVVRCCRGSVYEIRGGPDGVSVRPYLLPFFKFSNYGEKGADPIAWNGGGLFVRDKLDGSLLKVLREPDGNLLWTTNGSFELGVQSPEQYAAATDERLDPPYTFARLRDYALRGREREIENLPEMWTFLFELTSPYNRVVVPYRETRLTLLGCRDPEGAEHTPEWAREAFGLSFDTPRVYPLKNADEVIAYCASIGTNDREGVVVQDAHFNRVKIKAEHYLSLFHIKGEDSFSDHRIFQAIRQGSIDDALAAWPEIRPRTEEIIAEWSGFTRGVSALCKRGAARYAELLGEAGGDAKPAKKNYAAFVFDQYKDFSAFLFEAVKPDADLDALFDKIEYRDLRGRWLPAAGAVDVPDAAE